MISAKALTYKNQKTYQRASVGHMIGIIQFETTSNNRGPQCCTIVIMGIVFMWQKPQQALILCPRTYAEYKQQLQIILLFI